MGTLRRYLNATVATGWIVLAQFGAAHAQQTDRATDLLRQLANPDLPNWQIVEQELWVEWSKTGSPAMGLLLRRGRDALEAGELEAALDHLTALTDHAPDFAEGYSIRGSVYYQLGLLGPALDDIRTALTLNPDHFGAMIGLGAIMEEAGDIDRAFAAYQAAIAIHPNEPDLKDALERLEPQVSGVTL